MPNSSNLGADLPERAATKATNHAKLRIVFLAGRHAIYQCLSQTAQQHFSFFEIDLLDQLPATMDGNQDVSLVLLADLKGRGLADLVAECRARFPGAAIGLLIAEDAVGVDQVLIDQHLIDGVLSLTLPIDVLLAIISLLVSGGEYLPGVEGRSRKGDLEQAHPDMPSGGYARRSGDEAREIVPDGDPVQPTLTPAPHGQDPQSPKGIAALTTREREILQLVSEGCQNKIIANRMSLSEHTVKAHVHNLIAKLRVTNRTQAAACLHDQQDARETRSARRVSANFIALHGH